MLLLYDDEKKYDWYSIPITGTSTQLKYNRRLGGVLVAPLVVVKIKQRNVNCALQLVINRSR